jgi:hypothetical protein
VSRIAVSAALAAVLVLGAACGNDDASADPSPEASSSSASASPTATVEPAAGPALNIPRATVRVPKGWYLTPRIVPEQADAGNDSYSFSSISLAQIDSFDPSLNADELADNWLDSNSYPQDPQELPLTELDGVEVYHLAGMVQKHLYLEEFGAQTAGKVVSLAFMFSPVASPEERQEIIDSVLATFQWK